MTLPGDWTSHTEGTLRQEPQCSAQTKLCQAHCTAGKAGYPTSLKLHTISTNPWPQDHYSPSRLRTQMHRHAQCLVHGLPCSGAEPELKCRWGGARCLCTGRMQNVLVTTCSDHEQFPKGLIKMLISIFLAVKPAFIPSINPPPSCKAKHFEGKAELSWPALSKTQQIQQKQILHVPACHPTQFCSTEKKASLTFLKNFTHRDLLSQVT